MLKIKMTATAAAVALMAAVGGVATAQPAATYAPVSVEVFARVPAISSVVMSPDGKHLAALTSADGETVTLSIWKTDALDQPPYVIGSHPKVRFMNVAFVKNDRLFVGTRQTYTEPNTRTHLFKAALMDLKGNEIPIFGERGRDETEKYYAKLSSIQLLSDLPGDPHHIIAQSTNPLGGGDIYKIDVRDGREQRILRGSEKYGAYRIDPTGEPRARQWVDIVDGTVVFVQQIRHPDTGQWEDHFKTTAKERAAVTLAAFTPDPNIVLVASNKGTDKAGVYEYDVRARKMLEPAFAHKSFDVVSVRQDDDLNVLGFTYFGDRTKTYWTDEKLAPLERELRTALGVKNVSVSWTDVGTGEKLKFSTPDGADIRLLNWTPDFKLVLIEKSGPNHPPEFHMLKDGKLLLLGRSVPQVDLAALGETRLVQYPARDGLMIPAFLTRPPEAQFGKGPHPAIVLPHGGPWSRDSADWDSSGWTQYFASRGYAVLQPQFRGSEGWGQKLWLAGDAEWGQKMQDDKDDGAKWMIAQGIAAPDRIAMHGYSYGGYSAFAAGVRPNGLYQCSIAGAGVAELGSFQRDTYESRYLRDYQTPTIKGLDPLSVAETVSVPMLIYHGDRDQTVPIKQSDMFSAKLKAAGKPHRYVKLEDMGHQGITWEPRHVRTVLTEIETFLKNECGPGGL